MEEPHFQRSKYSERLHLTAADLENQQAYDSSKRRLLNRTLFGHGVVYGLDVRYDAARCGVLVAPGLAIDARGRELFVPKQAFFPLYTLFCQRPKDEDGWRLCIRYEEQERGEGHILRQDGTRGSVPNRVAEGYRILAVQSPSEDEICLAKLSIALADCFLCVRSLVPAALSAPHLLGRTATGVLRISGGSDRSSGDVRYSGEVAHGLGTGDVQITLAVEGYEQHRRCEVSGAEELFYAGLQTAVKLFPDSGTFVAAARVRGGFPGSLSLHWHAQKTEDARAVLSAQDIPDPQPCDEPPFWLEPCIALLNPGEQSQFFVCAPGGMQCTLRPRFTVIDGGGIIDDSGRYTAPRASGIYPIRAVFGDAPENFLCASAMVFERV